MTDQETTATPTTRRIMLGTHLREAREAAGITRDDAGYHIRGSASKISRMERGQVSFRPRDVDDLLTLYGVTDQDERDTALGLMSEANAPAWWEHYNLTFPSWFRTYMGMEQSAAAIFTYEPMFLPGLLQTEEYARTLTSAGLPDEPAAVVDQWVQLRMRRQTILTRADNPVELTAVVDESALMRTVDDTGVQARQFRHMLDMAELGNVTLRVAPLELNIWAAHAGPFMRLSFAPEDMRGVVYVEGLTGALFIDKPANVGQYDQVAQRLESSALSPEHSAQRIQHHIDNLG